MAEERRGKGGFSTRENDSVITLSSTTNEYSSTTDTGGLSPSPYGFFWGRESGVGIQALMDKAMSSFLGLISICLTWKEWVEVYGTRAPIWKC
ncbi:hypothetical protein NPIL_117731 [Nephila pilipes]|uniref:Uncharacterized protein n=1 Tax=Nephila pilipes TaxID=299642 RepID=A0A8X6PDV3_NEPPI|nr:hypothetical protein NPIL_117731 [Nephila pilipes]